MRRERKELTAYDDDGDGGGGGLRIICSTEMWDQFWDQNGLWSG